jgi:hypothetical protein
MGDKTILIIDDSYGQASVLRDDVEEIFESNNITDINILMLHNTMCAFELIDLLHVHGDKLRIEYVIADLTIGGSQRIGDKIIKLTGVDVVGFLKRFVPDVKVIIYTGNNLNRYIEANSLIAKKFKIVMGYEIEESLIIKRSLTIDERRIEITKRLFSDNVNLKEM